MSNHARIGPSSLSRVRKCPRSVRLSEHLPRVSSEHSARGTILHDVAATCLELGVDPYVFVGQTWSADGLDLEITDEHADYLQPGIDWINEQPGEKFIERLVKLDPWLPGQFGTMDVGMWNPETEEATAFDWKMGLGVPVLAEDNDQLRAYALGLYETILKPRGYEPKTIRLIIEQPWCPSGGSFAYPWTITFEELLEFGRSIDGLVDLVDDEDAPWVAGKDQCKFCPVKTSADGCAEYDRFNADLIGANFDDLDDEDVVLPVSDKLTPERRTKVLLHKQMIEQWLEKLHAEALEDALHGNPVPGLKAIKGRRGKRVFDDAKKADLALAPLLGDDRFTKKLITPTQAEKAIGKETYNEVIAHLVTQGEGKPILVPESDPRPPMEAVGDKFNDLNEEDD